MSSVVIKSTKLISGVSTLINNLINELVITHNFRDGYYQWRDLTLATTGGYVMIDPQYKKYNLPKIPKELDGEMFNIRKLHVRLEKVKKYSSICSNLSNATYVHKEQIPKVIQDYYITTAFLIFPMPTDKNNRKFEVNMELLIPHLMWLHEHNILMQTL